MWPRYYRLRSRGVLASAAYRAATSLHVTNGYSLAVQEVRQVEAYVLDETGGNVARAASILGVDRRSLYRMLRRYGLRSS